MRQDATILVCCHKQDYFYRDENYLPIQVGKAISNIDLGIQGDDLGENISSLNRNYCELTAHYWYWKNCKLSQYVGLNHYRRYFDFVHKLSYGSITVNVSEEQIKSNPPVLPDLDTLFSRCDIVLSKQHHTKLPVSWDYCMAHIKDDLEILQQVIKKLYPDYMEAYSHVMDLSNKYSPFNMFITHRGIFARYSEWLFDILFEVARKNRISAYPNQARVFGYMSERLLNVYVYHHKLRVKYLPVIVVTDESAPSRLKVLVGTFRNDLVTKLLTIKHSKDQ